MGSSHATRRHVLPLLIGGLLLQSVITLAPHRHDPGALRTATAVTDHWCGRQTTELFPTSRIHLDAPCLACAAATPLTGQTTATTQGTSAAGLFIALPLDAFVGHPGPREPHSARGPPVRA